MIFAVVVLDIMSNSGNLLLQSTYIFCVFSVCLYFLVYLEMSVLLMLSKLAIKGSQHLFMGYFLLILPVRSSIPGIFRPLFISVSYKTFLLTREDMSAL